jgi:hypothetical protein
MRWMAGLLVVVTVACGGSPSGPSTPPPLFVQTGSGNAVFDMPTRVDRVRIQAVWNQTNTSNFIVTIGGVLTVNAVLRDSITYDGTHLTNGGVVAITNSQNISSWTFTEVR